MRAFIKNLFRIAGGAIAAGILLVVISLGMDNKVYSRWHDVDLNFGDGYTIWNNNDYNNGVTNGDKKAGEEIASAEESENVSADDNYPVTYQDVKSLDFNMVAGKLYIREGKEFSVDITNPGTEKISSEVINGVWTLRENSTDENNYTSGKYISIFGYHINLNGNDSNNNYREVYVTLPKDFTAENISLSVGAGIITADSLSANTGDIEVGAGTCSIDKLDIKESSSSQVEAGMLKIDTCLVNNGSFSCAAGKIEIENGAIHNGSINCIAGSVEYDGSITGNSTVGTSVGKIDLELQGKEEDYNYTIDCNVGSLSINGTKYSGVSKHITQKNSADNNLALNCDVGSIVMNID